MEPTEKNLLWQESFLKVAQYLEESKSLIVILGNNEQKTPYKLVKNTHDLDEQFLQLLTLKQLVGLKGIEDYFIVTSNISGLIRNKKVDIEKQNYWELHGSQSNIITCNNANFNSLKNDLQAQNFKRKVQKILKSDQRFAIIEYGSDNLPVLKQLGQSLYKRSEKAKLIRITNNEIQLSSLIEGNKSLSIEDTPSPQIFSLLTLRTLSLNQDRLSNQKEYESIKQLIYKKYIFDEPLNLVRKKLSNGIKLVSFDMEPENNECYVYNNRHRRKPENIANYIDHTVLKQDATQEKVIEIIEQAIQYKLKAICINACWIPLAKKMLQNTEVKICTVIGFPLGATTTECKAFETLSAIKAGADEIDMVINIGFLKAKKFNYVREDIRAVVKAAKNRCVKVIIECCLLTDEEKVKACILSVAAGAKFVKTSTGMSKGGATLKDVHLMKKTVGKDVKVKAAGGIRSYEDAIKFLWAGADRIGTSGGHKLYKAK